MKKYMVYFSLFGKKMKTEILAFSEDDAKNTVSKKLKFHKVEDLGRASPLDVEKTMDDFFNMLGVKKK
jgi:hypothetical protein